MYKYYENTTKCLYCDNEGLVRKTGKCSFRICKRWTEIGRREQGCREGILCLKCFRFYPYFNEEDFEDYYD